MALSMGPAGTGGIAATAGKLLGTPTPSSGAKKTVIMGGKEYEPYWGGSNTGYRLIGPASSGATGSASQSAAASGLESTPSVSPSPSSLSGGDQFGDGTTGRGSGLGGLSIGGGQTTINNAYNTTNTTSSQALSGLQSAGPTEDPTAPGYQPGLPPGFYRPGLGTRIPPALQGLIASQRQY